MKKIGELIFKYIINIISIGCVWILLFHGGKYMFYSNADYDKWFEYLSVEPAQETFELGETPDFISTRQIYKESYLRWNDVIYCKTPEEPKYIYHSGYISKQLDVPVSGMETNKWNYPIKGPQIKSICYLRTSISKQLPYGLQTTQFIESGKFYFDNK